MGNVMHQAVLGVTKHLESSSHSVEIAAKIGKFIAPTPHGGADSRLQLATCHRLEGRA